MVTSIPEPMILIPAFGCQPDPVVPSELLQNPVVRKGLPDVVGPKCTVVFAESPFITASNLAAVLPSHGSFCVPLPFTPSVRYAIQTLIRYGSRSNASSNDTILICELWLFDCRRWL